MGAKCTIQKKYPPRLVQHYPRLVGAINSHAMFFSFSFSFFFQNRDVQIDQKEVGVLFQVQTRLAFSWALRSTTWLGEPDRDAPEANDHRKCGDLRSNRKEKQKNEFLLDPYRNKRKKNITKKVPMLFCTFEMTGVYRVSTSALNQRS